MPEWQIEPLVSELKAMKRRMDTLYQRSCGGLRETGSQRDPECSWHPQVDILETADEWIFIVDLPGVPEEELRVEIVDHALRISGDRPLPSEAAGDVKTIRSERGHGPFSRSLGIPSEAREDAVQAELKLGVLKIMVPKQRASQASQHKVTVHSL